MRRVFYNYLIASTMIVASMVSAACADDTDSEPSAISALQSALADLDQWIGEEANGEKWRKFLATASLQKQIAAGSEADPAVVSRVLEKYRTGVSGLEKPLFVKVNRALENWLIALRAQYSGDLAKMAWASRGDYDPATVKGRLETLRTKMQTRAERLEKELGTDTEFAENWKRYLRWELLALHFDKEVKISREHLTDLDRVLRRFLANRSGLELPVFLETTAALSSYRNLFAWHEMVREVAKRSRKKYSSTDLERLVYIRQLLGLQESLTRHQEAPTVETALKIGETLGLIKSLEQSPQLVTALQRHFARPNVVTHVSESAINQLAKRPVSDTQPVRDVILGAQIRGTAHTTGELTLETKPAEEHVELELQVVGNISSSTTGFKKPVLITSQGNTAFVSKKRLMLSDAHFSLVPSCTSARTNNHVCSVCKTGGNFGRGLIEKIAWKKVRKSKSQSESIAARHAERKVSAKFDKQVGEAIYQARQNYEEKVQLALVRTGTVPEELKFSSTESAINVQTKLASFKQISTDSPSIEFEDSSDFSLKIHETAVNNFLPTLLGGLEVQQDSEAEPAEIKGDVPPWLKEMAAKKNRERETQQTNIEPTNNPDAGQDEDAEQVSEFKPFSLQLNRANPLSVSFNDQKFTVRIRVAEMKTIEDGEEKIRNDWDFLISYALVQEGNQVKLRRASDVEMFPTGFDPRWDKQLTGEQVATRGALAKILKNRSNEGKGFPEEISLPQVEIPGPNETKIIPVLQHLYCDEGWLALGYRLP